MGIFALVYLLAGGIATASDADILRRWASPPPTIDGNVAPGEWTTAVKTPIAQGDLYTMNDAQYLYVLLDVGGDTTPDAVGDYFRISVDVDRNQAVTRDRDTLFSSCNSGEPFIKSYYLTEVTFTECLPTSPQSIGVANFGTTSRFPIPHRIWEFRFHLPEMGVDTSTWAAVGALVPAVRLHVDIVSQTPAFVSSNPGPLTPSVFDAPFYRVQLAVAPTYPPASTGPLFAGIGQVPSSYIDALGYATIDIPGYYSAHHAPFGGTLNVFGNFATLRSYGAGKYRVLYSRNGGPFTQLLQAWTNFRWNGTTWTPIAVGPSPDGTYPVPNAADVLYLPNLLMGWNSGQSPEGTYVLKLELIGPAGVPLADPGVANRMTLFVVNTPPEIGILDQRYRDLSVPACAVVTQGDAPHGMTWRIWFNDWQGALDRVSFSGIFARGTSTGTLYSDSYASHVDGDGVHRWNGVGDLIIPVASAFRATNSCAYTFTLTASSRVQNGYQKLFQVQSNISLTINLGTGFGGF